MSLKKFTACILVAAIATSSFSFATKKSDRDKLKSTNAQRREVRREINEKNKEMKNLSSKIYQLDGQIAGVEARLAQLQNQMKNLNINIKATKSQIESTENEIVENEELLKERIRAMYKTSDMTYFQLLLESKSIPDLVSNAYNVQQIVNADREMLEELENNRKRLEEQKTKLLAEKDRMTAVQQQIKSEQAQLEGYRSSQEAAKNEVAKDINLLKRREAELQKQSNIIEQRILAAMRQSGSNTRPYTGGALMWPLAIRGTLTSGYGRRSDPISGISSFHQGQDIAAPRGTSVLAAAAGTVITSRYQNSYGNVVAIDHGGGIVTVYAHNSALLVSEGSTVAKGQVIAQVGSTGYSTGNHLHFEVRINGKTVNPMGYYR